MAAMKKKAKLPTGERPKQLSSLAKNVKSTALSNAGKMNKQGGVLSPTQAAVRAGKMRDKEMKAKADAKKLDAAMKRGAASRKAIANKVVKKINQTAKYTPAGVIGKGAYEVGKAAGKVVRKIKNR
jgi:hypothetical protein